MANEEYKLTIKSEWIVDGHSMSTVQGEFPISEELHKFLEEIFWNRLHQKLDDVDEEGSEEW